MERDGLKNKHLNKQMPKLKHIIKTVKANLKHIHPYFTNVLQV